MKNFFWFVHKPADEREQALFNKAYYNALSVMWLGVSLFLVVVFYFLDFSVVRGGHLFLATFLLLVISYLSGWVVLRNEELVYTTELPKPKFKKLFLGIGVLYLYTLLALILFPQTYFLHMFILAIGTWLMTSVWTWLYGKSWSLHIRIVATLLAPVAVFIFFQAGPKSYLKTLAALALFFIVPHLAVGLVRTFIVFPLFVSTDRFEPEIYKERFILVDKIAGTYKIGDFVVFIDNENIFLARIDEVQGDELVVQTSEGSKNIERHRISGRVIKDIPSFNLMPIYKSP